ncbi:ATP-dependent DNA helicase RecQ [Flavobacterium branchiophilum]|uniref:DNA 3'-5' helicase n=1 Tax=Flavobacterium branchiophilum (strain FL-15) TaxID=1034807 RepID=G2Z1M9_FLABF|nr:DEAD/DEAH box helicase [Flavobacterium branchiophilum]CCB69803.1 Probable ATP-dependent RNA helicase, DEAD/DEAH box family [Flavobacterium branchiophilum FL-15]
MKQFKAGYIVDAISNLITDNFKTLNYFNEKENNEINKVKGLLQNLSAFDVQFPYTHKVDYNNIHPVLATINNIITRGLPTKAPINVEDIFTQIGLTKKTKDDSKLEYSKSINELNYNTIFELLHVIESGLSFEKANYCGDLGSKLEEKFLKKNPFVFQLFQAQRDFSTITPQLAGGKTVDFSFTSPYLHWNEQNNSTDYKTRFFEIDGPHHLLEEYVFYDTKRDLAAIDADVETFRLTENNLAKNEISYETLFSKNLYKIFEKNFNRNPNDFLNEYSLIFIPFAVARIQKTLIEYFITNSEQLKEKTLKIAIIERDFPCGALAIEGLKDLFVNLNALLEESDNLEFPEIELNIFENQEWVIHPDLHCGYFPKNEIYFGSNDFDVILDHSILRRSHIYKEKNFTLRNAIIIRSVHYFENNFENGKKIYCANLLNYKNLANKKGDGAYEEIPEFKKNIDFFIQNIFRKKSFRPGQLPIISRSLQRKPVIGLLPTGGGKSLTYQLPVFLQPGICLVVDPIKSLMEDQVRVLNNNWIDCCDFINSNLKREEKQAKFIDFKFGQTQFLFVSPERFVMEEFRNLVENIDNTKHAMAFSYCVIDEVHCLSEWGHDFRTAYLMLGKNAQKFIKTKKDKVTLIGLTATASFDVLTDIERELDIKHEDAADAVISIDNTIRKELFYDYVECNKNFKLITITDLDIKKTIGEHKQSHLNNYVKNVNIELSNINNGVIIKSLKQHYNEFEEIKKKDEEIEKEAIEICNLEEINDFEKMPSIIFCPHKSGSLGVTFEAGKKKAPSATEVFENLIVTKPNKGFFIGSDEGSSLHKDIQSHFQNFLSGHINYMVSTKAFGMGIDKEDVRLVYHINYSSSPESYIQEAGRAGRDKKKALCVNLINSQQFYSLNPLFINRYTNSEARSKLRHLMEIFNINFEGKYIFNQKRYVNKENLINEIKLIVPDFAETFEIASKYEKDENGEPKKEKIFTILEYNLDESVHDYFHQNSFKGIETEIYHLERFFTRKEEVEKTVFMQLSEIYNKENDRNIDFYITPPGHDYEGNIWLKTEEKIKFGRIINTTGLGKLTVDFNHILPEGVIDVPLTNNIFDFITENWRKDSPDTTLFEYLNSPVVNVINNGLSLEEYYDKYDKQLEFFIVPLDLTNDNLANLLIEDFGLIPTPPIADIEKYLKTLENQSNNFKDFIQRIEETWNFSIFEHDTYKKNKNKYRICYYSNMSSQDVLRVIYRLYSIDFISDYTLDYNKGLVKIFINKKDKDFYFRATEKHLLKYLSKVNTNKIIVDLEKLCEKENVFASIKQAVKVNLLFTYSDIAGKRKLAIKDIKDFINESIEQNVSNGESFKSENYNKNFKQLMFYYFNAKYAKVGFIEKSENRSLIDDWKNKIIDDWDIFIKYSKILNSENSFINECKMMRGSCKRIWRSVALEDTKDDYVLNLLYAYASFGLNNPYYFEEAEKYFLIGFENLYLKSNYRNLENKLNEFLEILSNSVKYEYSNEYMRRIKHKLMLKISTINTQNLIKELNNI